MTGILIVLVVLATGPLTVWGVRFSRKHRGFSIAAASFLLLMGVNARIDPPPPPQIEAVKEDEEGEAGGEPR